MDDPLLLRVDQVMSRTGLGRSTVFKLLRTGELESVRIGSARRVPATALELFVTRLHAEQNRSKAPVPSAV